MGAIRRALPYAGISGATALVAFLALPPQSLPDKAFEGDANLYFLYAVLSVLASVLLIAVVLARRGQHAGRRLRHLAVPIVLVILLPWILAVSGGGRSRWLTGLLFAAVAAGAHLALELPRRIYGLALAGVLVGAFALTASACQPQWRGEDFTATGLPLVVADIPGHRLTGTCADVGVIFLEYDRADSLVVTIARRCEAAQCVDLGGCYLNIATPVPGVTVRRVSASDLGSYPVSWTSLAD